MLKGLAFLLLAVLAYVASVVTGFQVCVFLWLQLYGQAALHVLYTALWTLFSCGMGVLSWANWESSSKNLEVKGW